MQKIIICFTMLLFSAALFSQQTTTATPILTKTDYLQKSKKQNTTARILLGSGEALVLIGIIFPKGEITHEGFLWNDYKNDGIKATCILSGTLLMLGSIPFFIASTKNKKKGIRLSFKNETVPDIYRQSIISLPLPSLAIKINL
ncbi:MAG: hypothetical protein ABIP79_06795 [Chitinophagaceae bacterium]